MITLPPFKAFLASNIPSVYDNTLSYYDELTKLIAYLEQQVVPAVNETAGQVDVIKKGLEDLKSYVDHYFDNLDVQEEINNKLDEMAEGGQLATIIAQFLAAAPVFAYGTIAEMAAATNLNDGCIARVLGNTVAADGDGAYYTIRTKTGADNPDGVNLVAIGDSLVGVRVQDAAVNNLQDQINNLGAKKILFIGDSYLDMYNGSTGVIDKFRQITGETNIIYSVKSGTGFAYTVDDENFVTLLNDIADDNSITDIIVVGGYNDQYSNKATVLSQIGTFCTNAKTKFPNAKVYIAMAGFTMEANKRYPIFETYQTYSKCTQFNANFLNGVECVMHDTSLFIGGDDKTHPNETGRQKLAEAIAQAWKNGYYSMNVGFEELPLTLSGDVTSGSFILTSMIINNQTYIEKQDKSTIYFAGKPTYTDIHNVEIEIATLTIGNNGSNFSPWVYNMYPIGVTCAVHDVNGYRTMNGKIQFHDNKVYLVLEDVETSNWSDITELEDIEINSFQAVFPTQMC